jgi:hypothetical protein
VRLGRIFNDSIRPSIHQTRGDTHDPQKPSLQNFSIQDRSGGIYVNTPDNLGLALRQQTSEVTGFSGQFADDFEVDPRTQADIRVL